MAVHLELVTPRGVIVEQDVDEVTVVGALGEFGVLGGHIPVLSALRPGIMRYRVGTTTTGIALGGRGFLEIGANDRVMVVTDHTARAEEIDLDGARQELKALEAEVAAFSGDPAGSAGAKLAQKAAWARARVDLASGVK